MRRMLIAAIFATAAGYAAYAQDPAPQPAPNATKPPESSMDQAAPAAPKGKAEQSPTESMGTAVPSMKETEPAKSSAEFELTTPGRKAHADG